MVMRAALKRGGRFRAGGFTLIEAMIVITILAILATIAVPSLRDMMITSQMRSAASDLFESLLLARSEAIKRSTSVDIVPTTPGDLTNGWSVQAGATVIANRVTPSNILITATAACPSGANAPCVTYNLSGRATTARSFSIGTTVSSHPITPRCVLIDSSGRPSIRNNACS